MSYGARRTAHMTHICQSPQWAKFKEAYGNKAVKAGRVTFFLTKLHLLPRFVGYCPKADLTKADFSQSKEAAKKEGCIFVKFDPALRGVQGKPFTHQAAQSKSFKPFPGLRKATSIFAQETILLDLTPSAEILLKDMKPKTR